jgi:hypothetical protein
MPDRTAINLAELQQLIHDKTTLKPGTLIGIDGMDGSGKSYLAKKLASLFCANYIEFDDFVNKHQGGFLDYLRYDELSDAIRQSLAERPVIIEGCCLLEVLGRLSITAKLHIYVKYLVHGIWQRGGFLDACCALAAIANEEEKLRMLVDPFDDPVGPGESLCSALKRDLIIYHYQYRPHQCADFVYKREYCREVEVSG